VTESAKPRKSERLKSITKCVIRDMSDPFFANVAPGLAYYFLLSIAPIGFVISYAAGLFFLNSSLIIKAINRYLPEELADIIVPFITNHSTSSGVLPTILFAIFTLYLGSRGVYMLIKVADYANGTLAAPTSKEVPIVFLKRHAKAVLLTGLLIAIMLLSLVGMVFGKALIDWVITFTSVKGLNQILYEIYYYLSFPIAFGLVFITLAIFYALMPIEHLKLKKVMPGAAVGTFGLLVASLGFLIYIKYFFNSNVIYGALSSIILLILWFFLMAFMMVIGIIVNKAVDETSPRSKSKPDNEEKENTEK